MVIGILIALYINNWNEERKERKKFDRALVDVEKELSGNIDWARLNFQGLAFLDSLYLRVLVDSMELSSYVHYGGLMNGLGRDELTHETFEKFYQFNDLTLEQESIRDELIQLHKNGSGLLDDYGDLFLELRKDQAESFKKYDWYYSWWSNLMHEDSSFKDFVDNDREYRIIITQMHGFASDYRQWLQSYDIQASSLYNRVYGYLDSIGMRHADSLLFQYDPEEYKHLLGKYDSKWCSQKNYIHDDSIVISLENNRLYWNGYRPDGPDTKTEIIPVNRHNFRDDRGFGIYNVEIDDRGEVKGIRFSGGPRYVLSVEKVR